MAELIYDQSKAEDGEAIFVVHVGRTPTSETVLASLEMEAVAPIAEEQLAPFRFSGFEFPAGDVMHLAQARAAERSVKKILVVDPYGLLRFAASSRYDRRRR